jgi:hypothetical protein
MSAAASSEIFGEPADEAVLRAAAAILVAAGLAIAWSSVRRAAR